MSPSSRWSSQHHRGARAQPLPRRGWSRRWQISFGPGPRSRGRRRVPGDRDLDNTVITPQTGRLAVNDDEVVWQCRCGSDSDNPTERALPCHSARSAHPDLLVIGLAVALKGSFGVAAQLLAPLAQKRRMDLIAPRHGGDRGSRLDLPQRPQLALGGKTFVWTTSQHLSPFTVKRCLTSCLIFGVHSKQLPHALQSGQHLGRLDPHFQFDV